MVRTLFAAAIALAAWLPMATPAAAGPATPPPACADRESLVEYLAEKYGEVPVARGLTARGASIELLVSAAGTWTILATAAGGPTCVVIAGEEWEGLPTLEPSTPA